MLLLAGPGIAKKEFLMFLDSQILKKTRLADGILFSTPEDELSRRVISRLDRFRKNFELNLLRRFEDTVKKGLTEKENMAIHQALKRGAVDTMIIASDYYAATPSENRKIIRMIELAEKTSATVEFITNPALLHKLHHYGSVIAILRYRIK